MEKFNPIKQRPPRDISIEFPKQCKIIFQKYLYIPSVMEKS